VKHRDRIVEYRRFKRNSDSATTLRNSIQHLEGNFLETAADTDWAVFGTLTWAIPNVQTEWYAPAALSLGVSTVLVRRP